MSTAEAAPVSAPAPGGGAVFAGGVRRGAVRPWLRLLRSELALVFRRWRNRALLAVVVAIPILLGTALRLAVPRGGDGGGSGLGGAFLAQVAGNGVFLAYLTLSSRARPAGTASR